MNNWAVELEQFNLKLEWIQGSKTTLVDSLSCLIEVVPEAKLESEPKGQEFGCYCFENLTPAHVEYVEEFGEIKIEESEKVSEIKIPLKTHELQEMQKQDATCRDIASKIK